MTRPSIDRGRAAEVRWADELAEARRWLSGQVSSWLAARDRARRATEEMTPWILELERAVVWHEEEIVRLERQGGPGGDEE